jgi:hypothetical protein
VGQHGNSSYYSPFLQAIVPLEYNHAEIKQTVRTYDFKVDGDIYEYSSTYHNNEYDNFLNLTSVRSQTAFCSPPLFTKSGKLTKSEVQPSIMNMNGTTRINGTSSLESDLFIEHYSGIAVQNNIGYQINYLFDSVTQTYLEGNFFLPSYVYRGNYMLGEEAAKGLLDLID